MSWCCPSRPCVVFLAWSLHNSYECSAVAVEDVLWRSVCHPTDGRIFHLLRSPLQRRLLQVTEYVPVGLVPISRQIRPVSWLTYLIYLLFKVDRMQLDWAKIVWDKQVSIAGVITQNCKICDIVKFLSKKYWEQRAMRKIKSVAVFMYHSYNEIIV